MPKDLSAQEAAGIIESAFVPLRCVAEPWDNDYRIRFRIFDSNDKPMLRMDAVLRPTFQDAKSLEFLLNQVRGRVARKGIELAPWSLPSRPDPAAA
ncbi:hypothetical protein [Pseudoxanthomonas wuyuanensis]|uniref:DUF1652 domain-containing protein n=1 Tax=Pseudoxanthomonas wuyuanensis TaxID=1073196 RepID=A0A286D4X2_9GAMM|nr:hypothetical protein [Pseudoxanthomonas wuyuanensis]KAF1719822.1 hypothetical protein CSC75_14145 [Pseudoxanthomonas wuyuanensis]SOD53710.1 hypothetical protein SAMN06296416_102549 [Pseudoxanthomonas wuyuanensis]